MIRSVVPFITALVSGSVAVADPSGDAIQGEASFARQCVACHMVADPSGEILAGRRVRTGPNLYNVANGPVGAADGFRYGSAIMTLNGQGATWDEDSFVGYVMDPTGWLRSTLNDTRARGKMAFKVRSEESARNIFAYLVSLSD